MTLDEIFHVIVMSDNESVMRAEADKKFFRRKRVLCGRKMLSQSGLNIITGADMREAAKKIVEATQAG